MQKKKGISLIVLIITIVVMVTLTTAIVLTLNNSGVIDKANEAVEKTNLKEVEQLASIVWAEEFMTGKRGETLKTAVLGKLNDHTTTYNIEVTDSGVTVTLKGEGGSINLIKNEYGFYFNQLYLFYEPMVADGIVLAGAVFQEDKILYCTIKPCMKDNQPTVECFVFQEEEVGSYESTGDDSGNITPVFSEDGRSLIIDGKVVAELFEYKDIGVKYGVEYSYKTGNDKFTIKLLDESNIQISENNKTSECLYFNRVGNYIINTNYMGSKDSYVQFSLYGETAVYYDLNEDNLYVTPGYKNEIIPNKIYENHLGFQAITDDEGNITISLDGETIVEAQVPLTGYLGSENLIAAPLFGGNLIMVSDNDTLMLFRLKK